MSTIRKMRQLFLQRCNTRSPFVIIWATKSSRRMGKMNTSKSIPARLLLFVLLSGSFRCFLGQSGNASSLPENTAATPSLPATAQFIQSKLNEWTKFRYSVSVNDPGILRDQSIAYDTISITPDQCGLKFSKHVQSYLTIGDSWKVSNLPDTEYEFSFRNVR